MSKPAITTSPHKNQYYHFEVAELTQHLLLSGNRGLPLPATPESNPVEQSIRQDCQTQFDENAKALQNRYGDPQGFIMNTAFDPNVVTDRKDQATLIGKQALQSYIDQHNKAAEELADIKVAFQAFKYANYISRPIQQKGILAATILTIVCFMLETAFNGWQMFASGHLPGGLLGSTAIALVVSVVNSLLGFLLGKYSYRHLLVINKSPWKRFAFYTTFVSIATVILVNGLFAYLRAFPEGIGLGSREAYLSFVSVFTVGFAIFVLVFFKWRATQEPIIEYEHLHNAIEHQCNVVQQARQTAANQITDWHSFTTNQFDQLLANERKDYVLAEQALNACYQLDAEITALQKQYKDAYEIILTQHRLAVLAGKIKNTPSYFHEKPEITINHQSLDLAKLERHLVHLKTQLKQLELNVKTCKQAILDIAEQFVTTIDETQGESSCA